MATKVFMGRAAAVAQVTTVQITTYDAAGTYTLTAGSGSLTTSVSVGGDTDADTTASNLASAWNAAAHPYISTITATVATDTITLTGDTPGVPFTVASSATGGTAAIGSPSTTTAAESKHHAMLAENYAGGVAPVTGDSVILDENAPNVCWGLATGLGNMASLTVPDREGLVGLDSNTFAISADGATSSTTVVPEYRETYLQAPWLIVAIGSNGTKPNAPTTPAGRIKVDCETAETNMVVHSVRGTSIDGGMPACRVLINESLADCSVYSAAGGFGIGMETEESVSLQNLDVFTNDSASKVYTGPDTTLVNLEQSGGSVFLRSDSTVTSIKMHGGTLHTQRGGDALSTWTITTLDMHGGTAYLENGNGVTTLNGNGGHVDLTRADLASIGTLNPRVGFSLSMINDETTITTINDVPGRHKITYS